MTRSRATTTPSTKKNSLPPIVLWFGVVSLLTDVGTEMIYPLLPLFLADVLHAPRAFIGAVEGAAEATASLLKLASGRWSDRLRRRKPLTVAGYGLSSLVRPLVGLALQPWHVLATRVVDRVGKGLRGSPRDALLADATRPEERGRAYGFHQAMDNAGALIGPLLATALIALGLTLRKVFLLAAVPGALAMTTLVFGVREEPRAEPSAQKPTRFRRQAAARRNLAPLLRRRRALRARQLVGRVLAAARAAVRRGGRARAALVDGAQRHEGGAVDLGRRAVRSDRPSPRHRRRLAALRRHLSRVRIRDAAVADVDALCRLRPLLFARRRRGEGARRRADAGRRARSRVRLVQRRRRAGRAAGVAGVRRARRSRWRARRFTASAALAALASLWLALVVRSPAPSSSSSSSKAPSS